MQKEEGQIAHSSILARSRSTQQMLARFGIRHANVDLIGSPHWTISATG
jgi:hypothetical protein